MRRTTALRMLPPGRRTPRATRHPHRPGDRRSWTRYGAATSRFRWTRAALLFCWPVFGGGCRLWRGEGEALPLGGRVRVEGEAGDGQGGGSPRERVVCPPSRALALMGVPLSPPLGASIEGEAVGRGAQPLGDAGRDGAAFGLGPQARNQNKPGSSRRGRSPQEAAASTTGD